MGVLPCGDPFKAFVALCGLFVIYTVLLFATYVSGVERAIILLLQMIFFGLLVALMFQHSLVVPPSFERDLALRTTINPSSYRSLLVLEMALMLAIVVSMCMVQAARLWPIVGKKTEEGEN